MALLIQTAFPYTFSSMTIIAFLLEFHRTLSLRVQLTIKQIRFRLCAKQMTSNFLNHWWPSWHIFITWPQWATELSCVIYKSERTLQWCWNEHHDISNHWHLDCLLNHSGTHQRKRQSSMSVAFVRGTHRWLVESPHKGPIMWKMFPFDDIIMTCWCQISSTVPFHWLRMVHHRQLDSSMSWLTHWGRMTHICVSKLTIIGSDNGLPPGRRQAIIWTNAGILLIGPLETNFSGIFIKIHTFSFKKMHVKMLSGKRRPFCLGLNMLSNQLCVQVHHAMITRFFGAWGAGPIQGIHIIWGCMVQKMCVSRAHVSNYIPQYHVVYTFFCTTKHVTTHK